MRRFDSKTIRRTSAHLRQYFIFTLKQYFRLSIFQTPTSSIANVKKTSGKRGRLAKMEGVEKEMIKEDNEILRISEVLYKHIHSPTYISLISIYSTQEVKKTSEKERRQAKTNDDTRDDHDLKSLRTSKVQRYIKFFF